MTENLSHGAPRSMRTSIVALLCAGMITIMLLAQLFGYEDFATTLMAIMPFSERALSVSLAAALVVGELIALPYLLGMYMSKLLRIVSFVCAFLVAGFWLIVSLTNAHAENSGLFSTTLELPGGILAAFWSLLVFGLLLHVLAADSKFRHDTVS